MLLGPPSKAALRDTFERVLTGVLDGSMAAAPECNGLDEQTGVQDPRCENGIRAPARRHASRAEPCPSGGGAEAARGESSPTVTNRLVP